MATTQLPDPDSLPFCRYIDQTETERDLNNRNPNPRVITDYVFSSDNWQGLPAAQRTVDGILSQRNSDEWTCIICGRFGLSCPGASCVAAWQSRIDDRRREVEIRSTGSMGLGVFAKWGISGGDVIDEYIGEVK